ncbi:MAG: TIGR03943 family protein [Actinomycetota bacterium]
MNATTGDGVRPRSASDATWSAYRVATGIVLTLWAGTFWFLLVSGRSSQYLSSRTEWVVPVGAVLLTVAAVGRLLTARERDPTPLGRRQAWMLGLLLVPVLVTLVLPPSTLTSFAAGRRGDAAAAGYTASASEIGEGALTLLDVAGAQTSKEGQQALAKRAGEQVSFVGFVDRELGTPADEFLLTRFIVSCCVADATVASVRVVNVPPGTWEIDEWVTVDGTIYPLGREVIVDQSSITAATEPNPAYLSP